MNHQRTKSEPGKYVMDHECPATDLEDKLLLSYSTRLLGASGARRGETQMQSCCHLRTPATEDAHTALESQGLLFQQE